MCQNETIFTTWCVNLLAPLQEKNNGLFCVHCQTTHNALTPSFDNILLRAYFPGHEETILSGETSTRTLANNDCMTHEKNAVVLVQNRAGVEDNAVAMKLRATGDWNEVSELFLNILFKLSANSLFF